MLNPSEEFALMKLLSNTDKNQQDKVFLFLDADSTIQKWILETLEQISTKYNQYDQMHTTKSKSSSGTKLSSIDFSEINFNNISDANAEDFLKWVDENTELQLPKTQLYQVNTFFRVYSVTWSNITQNDLEKIRDQPSTLSGAEKNKARVLELLRNYLIDLSKANKHFTSNNFIAQDITSKEDSAVTIIDDSTIEINGIIANCGLIPFDDKNKDLEIKYSWSGYEKWCNASNYNTYPRHVLRMKKLLKKYNMEHLKCISLSNLMHIRDQLFKDTNTTKEMIYALKSFNKYLLDEYSKLKPQV